MSDEKEIKKAPSISFKEGLARENAAKGEAANVIAKAAGKGEASLEAQYPGAKITRAGEQARPEGGSANRLTDYEMESPNRADKNSLEPYEVKASKAKFARTGSGSSGVLPNDKSGLDRPHLYKKGGKVAGKLATRGYGISKHGKK